MGKDWYDGCMTDQKWRLNHLYYIRSKEKGIVRFKMNWAQEYLFDHMHTRNNILKARQLGMSTFTAIYILDCCLHQDYYEAGIVDKTDDDAKEKLRKIRVAYEFMLKPPPVVGEDYVEDPEDRKQIAVWAKKIAMKVGGMNEIDVEKRKLPINTEGAEFGNGSAITTGTSLRGGTYSFLHLSEFGYVAHRLPQKAEEIMSGAQETVPSTGIILMESTHEGAKSGRNYEIIKGAMENEGKAELDPLDYKFFFFTWWKQKEYRVKSKNPLDPRLDSYFEELRQQGIELDEEQKRWYLAKEKTLTNRMKTEYPSTPEEAFMALIEGAIYGTIISQLRSQGRTSFVFETDDIMPLYVSWDLGTSDNTTMWLIQPGNDGKFYILDFYSSADKPMMHYINHCRMWEREHGQVITRHLLPHDSAQRGRWDGVAPLQKFIQAGLAAVHVPQTRDKWNSINATRQFLKHCVFHARVNKPIMDEGIERLSGMNCLESYRKAPMGSNGVLRDEPVHDESSHGADSFRIFVEAYEQGLVSREGARKQLGSNTSFVSNGFSMSYQDNSTVDGRPAWW